MSRYFFLLDFKLIRLKLQSLSPSSCRMNDVDGGDVVKQKGKRRLFIYEFVISVQVQSLTWMISIHVKEILR